jgi:hypothetical protein
MYYSKGRIMKTHITHLVLRRSMLQPIKPPARSRINLVLLGIVCVGLVGTLPAQTGNAQSVLYVQADAVGAGDGTSWADAYSDLQDALTVAAPGNDIWVAAGTYLPGGPGDRSATFQLKTGIGLYGGFAGTEASRDERDPAVHEAILSGDLNGNDKAVLEPADMVGDSTRTDNSYHVVTGSGADESAVLDGFVITGGNANRSGNTDGGGMINVGTVTVLANPTLVNCRFHGNSADRNGGGIYNELGDPMITDCVFSENHGDGSPIGQGGGGVHNTRGSLTLRRCRFGGNTSIGGGAGLYNYNASTTVIDTSFGGNRVVGFGETHNGGGIRNHSSDATIINCTFTGNSAPYGGGIHNTGNSSPSVVNCIFTRNEADVQGGGFGSWTGKPTVINCTFVENSAVTSGGGLGHAGGSRTTVSNCIFWGNSANSSMQIGGGAVVTYSCVQGGMSGEGNIDMDPLFLDPDGPDGLIGTADDDLRFGRQSPCFDGGDDAALPLDSADLDGDGDSSERTPLDLDGNPRSYGDWVDMGAYEYAAATAFPLSRASDVFRDVVLTWEPSENLQTHNVYFGTSGDAVAAADTANPLDVLVSEGQEAASFDPGQLEFRGSYYWRVDDVNGAPDFSVIKGDVRSFTVEALAYPITAVSATASSSMGLSVAENTINGSGMTDDLHGISVADMWVSAGIPATIDYAFDQAYKLHEAWIWNSNQLIEAFLGFGAKDIDIAHSLDGENWTVLEGVGPLAQAPGTEGHAHNNTIDFGGAVAQHVRMTINSVHGFGPQVSLSEVQFYATPIHARNPLPAVGSITDSTNVILNWVPGRVAASHDVLFSESIEAIEDGSALIANTTDAWLDLSDLALTPSTTYYWRVDEVNELADPPVYEGTVWHFTTP